MHPDSVFTDDKLDKPVEALRDCLRDLKKIVDRPTALASRERCKHWMQQAVNGYEALRQEYEHELEENEGWRQEATDLEIWAERFNYLQARISDLRRGLISIDELERLSADISLGRMATTK